MRASKLQLQNFDHKTSTTKLLIFKKKNIRKNKKGAQKTNSKNNSKTCHKKGEKAAVQPQNYILLCLYKMFMEILN